MGTIPETSTISGGPIDRMMAVGPDGLPMSGTGASRNAKGRQVTTITSSTAETSIVTKIPRVYLDVYGLVISNSSATASEVTIKDSLAGSTVMTFEVPATETRGFMLPWQSAVQQSAANQDWTATCGTSVASIKITALFAQIPVV